MGLDPSEKNNDRRLLRALQMLLLFILCISITACGNYGSGSKYKEYAVKSAEEIVQSLTTEQKASQMISEYVMRLCIKIILLKSR